MSESKEFTVSEVIDSFGINGHTWLMFVLLGLANIFDGYDFMVVNSTNTYLAASFGLIDWSTGAAVVNSAALGSLTTWGLLGMVLGGACGGIMSDKLGRKKMLIIACFFYGIFTLPQAFSQSLGFFAAFRLIAGFGVGSCIPVVTTCFSETIPSKHRGVFVTFGMAFMVAGWVLAGLVAQAICGMDHAVIEGWCAPIKIANGTETFENWRICYMIGALPVLYAIALIFLMHETPHWYANNGQNEKAVEALKILAKNAGRLDEAEHLDPNALVIPPKPSKTSVNILFSKKFIVGTAAIWTTYFVGQFCVYGMNAWIPTWFQGVGYTAQQSVMLQTWNNVAAIASNICVGFVSDRIGRKKNLCFSWILCIVAIILCSVFIVNDPEQTKFVLYVALMLLFGFALNYAITAVQPLMPEQYPTALRNTGVAWCQAFARFGGSASSIVLGFIAAQPFFASASGAPEWSKVVLVLIVPFVLAEICSLLFVRETGGKTMDQLAAESAGDDSDTGMVPFIVMMACAVFLAVLCIVCPLAVPGWKANPMAMPLDLIALLLPFVIFFIFAGPQALKKN